jgi:signal transduction histidine kinase
VRELARRAAAHPAGDVPLALAVLAVLLAVIVGGWESRQAAAAAVSAGLCAPIALRRRAPVVAGVAEAVMIGLLAALDLPAPDAAIIAPAVIAYSAGAHAPRWPGVLVVLALMGALIALAPDAIMPAELCTVGPWALGLALRIRRDAVSALADRARDLEREEARLVALATQRERLRIAAELHDSVGHHLAVVVLQAGAARMTGAAATPSEAAERRRAIRISAEGALAEIDRLVELSDDDERDAGARLAALVAGVRAAGTAVSIAGEIPAGLSPAVARRAVRVVQEALTNAAKHASGARVEVRIRSVAGGLEVLVADEGAGSASAIGDTGSGSGLAGLTREVEADGGSLIAGPAPGGGWAVRALIAGEAAEVIPRG